MIDYIITIFLASKQQTLLMLCFVMFWRYVLEMHVCNRHIIYSPEATECTHVWATAHVQWVELRE